MKTWSIIILPYMISELKLSGNELIVYAFVNGFSGANGHGWHGNLSTLAEHTGMSIKTCQRALTALVQKKFVKKLKSKTVISSGDTEIVNTLPLYIAAYSEGEKLEVEQEEADAVEALSENVQETSVPDIEAKKEPEIKPDKEVRKNPCKQKKEKDLRFEAAKNNFLEVYKELYAKGKVPTELTSVNSALINKRLKDLFEKKVTPEQLKCVFKEMALDNFCVEQLHFELAPLLSENVFYRWYNKTAAKYKRTNTIEKKPVIKQVCYCRKCGRELYNGLCGVCDIDKIL